MLIRTATLVLSSTVCPLSDTPARTQAELGRVRFEPSFESALARAEKEQKPVLLVFQEVPGCSTCVGFGRGPLSTPGCVEAIETLFVPYLCRNNVGGAERELLERYKEPAWNNPVVRVVDARGKDLIPRAEQAWTDDAFLEVVHGALKKSGTAEPAWLAELRSECSSGPRESTVLAMHCFWEGQARLGSIPGVLDVRPAFAGGSEVCEVIWSPERTDLTRILRAADERGAFEHAFVRSKSERESVEKLFSGRARELQGDVRAAPASDDLRALKRDGAARLLPLTRAERVRANAALALDGSLAKCALSPRTLALYSEVQAALAQGAQTLKDLEAPTEVDALGAHDDALRARLKR